MNKAVVGLGSNIDPENNIAKAREILNSHFNVTAQSQFIKTKPVGYTDQADFINGSVYLETLLEFEELKLKLKSIEEELGRERANFKYGPRSIDLDIIVWNKEIKDNDFYNRDFLKNATLELIPDLKY